MEANLSLALEELRSVCSMWRTIGCHLEVRSLKAITANHKGDDEKCLEEMLRDWLKNGKDPSWERLCSALEAPGLFTVAKHIREKYVVPAIHTTTQPINAAGTPSSTPQQMEEAAKEIEATILMIDVEGELVTPALLGIWTTKSKIEVQRGELLEIIKPKHNSDAAAIYQVRGKKAITVKCREDDVTPLNGGVQCALLEAIPTPLERFSAFMTNGWLEWGASVKVGDMVYIRVMKKKMEYCSTACVLYIGAGKYPGTMFGVQITDSKYYGYGSTDGKFDGVRYFTCPVGNGLFLSLASVAKEPEWLKLQYHPRSDIPPPSEVKKQDNYTSGLRDGVEQLKLQYHPRSDIPPPSEVKKQDNSTSGLRDGVRINSNLFPIGTRVIVRPTDGRQVRGTVRWLGKISIEVAVSLEEEIPVYGIETDINVSWTNFLPQFPPVEKFTFTVSNSAHGKVFIPISMVEPDEKIVESSIAENSVHAKNVLVGAGDNSRQAALMNEQMLATELGPEVTGETSMEEQLELLRRFENGKLQYQQPASYSQSPYNLAYDQYPALTPYTALNPLLGVGSALLPSSLNPPIYQSSDGFYEPPVTMDVAKKFRIIQRLSIGRDCEVEGDIFMHKGGVSVGVVKVLEPMSPMLNYFEYEIINRGAQCAIGIGVGELTYPLDRMPGWNVNGIGYHADDGKLFHTYETADNGNPYQQLTSGYGEPFGPTSTTGDRMGCGVDFDSDVGYGYVNIFFTRNGHQVGELIKLKRPTHGLYPLVGLHSSGEKVRYLGHCRRVPHSVSSPLYLNTSPWLRSNGVRFKDDSLTLEYCGRGLQLEGHDVGVAQANLTANNGNHYFEMEVLSAGKEGLLAIGFAEPTYPLHLYPGSTKGSIAYHAGHLYKEIVPFQPTPSMKCNKIGCGIQFDNNQSTIRSPEPVCKIFFTKDGEVVGTVECSVPKDGFYPFVAVSSLGGKVRVNFKSWTSGIDIVSFNGRINQDRDSTCIIVNDSITNLCDECNAELDGAKKELTQTKKELHDLKEEHSKFKAFWIVARHHVTVLEKSLGGGAWGYVKEGKFRGQKVAVKCIHETIITDQTIKRVYREICSMVQLRHPNLVLFIAAVLDDQGGPMIITELLDTTLRKAYEDSLLNMAQCMDIFRDVACALCYLHELEAPIIHRDVSSSNVLLKAMAKDQWKAKLSDFGSANWAKEASTMGEGAIVYTAPEAYPIHPSLRHTLPPQTTKIDVYSYGILLCEVTLRKFPSSEHLSDVKEQLKTKHVLLHSLVHKCTQDDPVERPAMATVLEELCY